LDWAGVFFTPRECSVALIGWPKSIPPPFKENRTVDFRKLKAKEVETILEGFEKGTIRFERNTRARKRARSD